MATQPAPAPAQAAPKNAPAIPFGVASRQQDRLSLTPPIYNLQSAASTQISPQEIPATGYMRSLMVQVIMTATGGTPAFLNTDAPFSVISQLGLRAADGTPIIVPLTGFQHYLVNKYFGKTSFGQTADPRYGIQYVAAAGGVTKFWLEIPLEIDPVTGFTSIPAMAANRSYQMDITLNSIGGVFSATTPPTGVTVQLKVYARYWTQPAAANTLQQAQQQAPLGLGSLTKIQLETPTITPGDQWVKSNNVGQTIRNHVLVLRTSAGVRTDTDWPNLFQLILDNEPQNYWPRDFFEQQISQWYGYGAATKDIAGGLDTGVYPIPYHAFMGSLAGDPNNSRGQLLYTNSGSQLQFYGSSFGAAASKLEILSEQLSAPAAATYAR